jgi:hypothetical protein
MTPRGRVLITLAAIAAATAATGCGTTGSKAEGENPTVPRAIDDRAPGGLRLPGLFGGGDDAKNEQTEIGVNSFLWRATMDTLSFMPLTSADPFGGVVITDWYANPQKPNERFKATVYILDTRLRADGVKVALFRETLTANGWQTAPTDPDTALQLENAILKKARELKIATIGG